MDIKKIPLPGFRTIKTAVAVLACLLIYAVVGRDNVLLALFATFICIQDSIKHSVQSGVNRIAGTVIGGAFGWILLLLLDEIKEEPFLWYLVVSVGVVALIYFLNLAKRNDCISMAAIVFLIVMLDTSLKNPLMYTINYVVDSIIGIVIAVGVNHLPLGYVNEQGMFKESGDTLHQRRPRYKLAGTRRRLCNNCCLYREKTNSAEK